MAMIKSRRILCFSFVLFVLFWNFRVCSSKTFKIAFLAPGPSSNYHINSDTSVDGLKLALQSVLKNPNILNGHKIAVKFYDTKCNAQSAVTTAMLARTTFGPDVIVGPPCQEGLIQARGQIICDPEGHVISLAMQASVFVACPSICVLFKKHRRTLDLLEKKTSVFPATIPKNVIWFFSPKLT